MKKYIKFPIIIAACAAVFAACDDNDWNNRLDGFDQNGISDVRAIEYTLTDADYSAIASNSVNQALAGEDKAAALKAVGTNHFFSDEITPREYVPAFLDSSKFPYFTLDNGSAVKITYKTATNLPDEIAAIAGADTYEVSEDDYKFIWGDEEKYVEAFAPSKPASAGVVKILNDQFPDAEAGDYYIVTYKTSSQEPVFGSSEPQPEEFKMSEVISGLAKGDVWLNPRLCRLFVRRQFPPDRLAGESVGHHQLVQLGFAGRRLVNVRTNRRLASLHLSCCSRLFFRRHCRR